MLTVIAENLQPFDVRAKAAFGGDEAGFVRFLKDVAATGVTHIDVNTGPIRRNKRERVRFFVETIERHTDLRIVIDSADPAVIADACEIAQRTPVINAFSLEERKLREILPIAASTGADIIGLMMDGSLIPRSTDDKLLVAERMLAEAEQAGVPPSKVILDPVVAPLGWEDGAACARANVEFIRAVPLVFGDEVRSVAGLSNLTTRAAGGSDKGRIQALYLAMLRGAGLNMVLCDVFNAKLMEAVKLSRVVDGSSVFSFADFH